MRLLFCIVFLCASISSFSQERVSVYQEVEEMITEKDTLFNNIDTSFTPDELIGKVIAEKQPDNSPENSIYFVNDKYILFIDNNGEKTLGVYTFKILKNIPIIILLTNNGEKDDNYEGVIVKKGDQTYKIDWNHSYNYVYDFVELEVKDILFEVEDEIVSAFNFYNPDVSFDILNGKIGVNYKGEKAIDNVCDSLRISGKIATIYNSGKTSLYNLKGKLLSRNTKAVYSYSHIFHQVIDTENKMYFIDTLGKRYDDPTKHRSMWGNDSDGTTIEYYTHKKNILKIVHHSFNKERYKEPERFTKSVDVNYNLYLLQRDVFNSDDSPRWVGLKEMDLIVKEKKIKEFFLLKNVFNEEEYLSKLSFILLSEFTSCMIKLPKGFKKVKFLNDSTTEMSVEDYWYYVRFYRPLTHSYVIAKKSDAYGVWDIEEEKEILSFDYNNITSKKGTHLLLEKNNLYTYYPYIGLQTKYAFLGDYEEYYARFEYPDGKKGWIDRKGVEFFDD